MGMVETLGLEEDQPIEHNMPDPCIENARRRWRCATLTSESMSFSMTM